MRGKLRSDVLRLQEHPVLVISTPADDRAIVSICIQKEPDSPPIPARTLNAVAFDVCDTPLQRVAWPRDDHLMESAIMGVVATGRYEFALDPDQNVRYVDVRLGDTSGRFELRKPESRSVFRPKEKNPDT